MRKDAALLTAALGAALLLPAPALAGTQVFGSDLSRSADVVDSDQQDVVFWPSALASGGAFRVPADGQVKSVRIRGFADSASDYDFGRDGTNFTGGERLFHIQVLEPLGGGQFRIRDKGTSNHLYLPGTRQGATKDTVTEFALENLCAKQGDYIAFNGVGGWDRTAPDGPNPGPYANGTPLHIFAHVAGSALHRFRGADQSNNGATISGSLRRDRELLLQATLGTAEDAFYECPGGTYNPYKAGMPLGPPLPPPTPPRPQFLSLPASQKLTVSKQGRGVIAIFCMPGTSTCSGYVQLFAGRKAVTKRIPFAGLGARRGGTLTYRLTTTGLRLFRKGRGKLAVRVVAVTNPGTPEYVQTIAKVLKKRTAR